MRHKLLGPLAAIVVLATTPIAIAQTGGSITSGAPAVTPPAASDLSKDTLLGRDVFSQDQTNVGQVERVMTAQNGQVQAIMIKTGGFLGFGTRLVSVPEGKFHMRGQNVQLQLTAEEVQKLPEQKDNS